MISWTKNRYNTIFLGLLLSVVAVFIYVRPFTSPWHPFIAGDGLGYYSYLPAKFIHHDQDLNFKWFNAVYDSNYVYDAFDNPEDNLLVQYGDKRINKYYPGLSFIWSPFFLIGHIGAKVFDYPQDGFSQPYQWSIALGSLFYLLLGLIYLRKLLQKLFGNELVALLVPFAIFFGTNLFFYGTSCNTLSHAYSFTFITLFIYFGVSFCRDTDRRWRNLLLCIFCLVLTVSIRPLNGIIVCVIPAFLPPGFLKEKWKLGAFGWKEISIALLTVVALIYHFHIQYTQTGSLFSYTYTNEKFDLADAKFKDSLWSYHNGLFLYVPLLLLSLGGIFFLPKKQRIILPLFFFAVIYLYASWWFWPITKRAIIDYYVLPAIFLAALLARLHTRRAQVVVISLIGVMILHYQLKNYQVNKGILSEFSTYGEVYWDNYFRLETANAYPVSPETILKQEVFTEDFEADVSGSNRNGDQHADGARSLLLDQSASFPVIFRQPYPSLFGEQEAGWRKIRFSFDAYFEDSVNFITVFIQFYKNDTFVSDVPFYVISEYIHHNEWDHKEFGYEIADTAAINPRTVDSVSFAIWNSEAADKPAKRLYIDNAKAEFLLTDRSFETIR